MTNVTYNNDGDECVADLDASGNPLRAYTWGQGIDDLLAMTVYDETATNTYYAVKDHLGSVHALVDESGTAALTVTYDAWGNVQSAVGNGQSAVLNRYLFQGREYSFATGLYFFRARWYSPEWGRWLSNDPIGISGGLNLYEFCGNNPVNFTDPFGLWGIQFGIVNLGVGDPWMIFDNSSWMDISRGAAATLDGIFPFADPLESAYADECGNVDSVYKTSRHLGGISRDLLIAAAIPNIGTWAKNPVLYEIGQTTVSPGTYNIIQGMSAIEKGRHLVNAAGGSYVRAAFGTAWGQVGATVGTGLTPGGYLLGLGALEASDYQSRK